MKAFALLLTLAFASYFVDVESKMTMPQITKALKTVRKSCVAKSGVSNEVLDATKSKDEFAEDRALMCFYKCVMTMMKTLKDDKFDAAEAVRQANTMLPEEYVDRANAVTAHCGTQLTATDGCEVAWQYAKCNWEMDKEAYFFP